MCGLLSSGGVGRGARAGGRERRMQTVAFERDADGVGECGLRRRGCRQRERGMCKAGRERCGRPGGAGGANETEERYLSEIGANKIVTILRSAIEGFNTDFSELKAP